MKFFTLFLATLLYAGNALMLRTVNNHAAVLDAREQVQQTQTAMYDWKDGIIYKEGEEDKKKPLDLAVFAKDGLIKKAHKENTDRKDKTFVVDMEVEGIKFSLADIHMDGNGPDGSPKKAAKTIKQFLMDEGLNKDRLKGLDAVAGDSNITPHKVSKTIPGLKPNADLTRQIAKALSDISSDGSDPWCVYMANTQVGKRRVGFSLMNNQIFKSEPQAGGAELDGTLLAVKNNNPPVTFEGDKFRKGCWKKGDGDLGKPENVEGAATSTAFKFADPIDVPTGSIFLDHAALKFKIKGTEFFVVNVGAILHVKYKTWVDGDTWMATLKNGIQTAQALDQKLYTAVRTALLGANDLDPAVKDSIKLVFKPEKAEDFWGKGDAPPGADPGAKFETSALYKAEDAQQMKIVAILKAAVPSFLKDVSDNKDKYYKNGKAPKDDLGKQQAAVKTKLEAAGQDAKAIWKAIGEGLTDAGLKQPYGGFGNDIAKLPASATQMVSVDAIYGRLDALVKKGGVVIASEVSGPYFKTVSEGGAKQDDNEEPNQTAPKQEDNEEPKKTAPKQEDKQEDNEEPKKAVKEKSKQDQKAVNTGGDTQ